MNKEEVYLKGYIIGHAADTLGYRGLMVQLENLDVVEIDKSLVHKDIDKLQKVKVSQGIANYIEYTKTNEWDLLEAMDNVAYEDDKDLRKWFNNNSENFALAWIFGYDVEKEKRYFVKIKGVACPYLNHDTINELWFYNQKIEGTYTKNQHTRKELEEAGFGEVFNSPLFEVEEVEE